MFDKRLGIHLAYERHLREMYGPAVFEAAFPLAKDFKEAVAARQPVSPTSRGRPPPRRSRRWPTSWCAGWPRPHAADAERRVA